VEGRSDRVDGAESQWMTTFMTILPLLYVGSAYVVACTVDHGFPVIVPLLVVVAAIITLLVPSRRSVASSSTAA
jgi:hypothetical protein